MLKVAKDCTKKFLVIVSLTLPIGCSDTEISNTQFVTDVPVTNQSVVKYHKKKPNDNLTVQRVTFESGIDVTELSISETSRFQSETPGSVCVQFKMKDAAESPRTNCYFEYVSDNGVIHGQGSALIKPTAGQPQIFSAVATLNVPTAKGVYQLLIFDRHTTIAERLVEVN